MTYELGTNIIKIVEIVLIVYNNNYWLIIIIDYKTNQIIINH